MHKKNNRASLKRFSTSELKEFDGKGGRPSYVAFKGKVYDVTNSSFWKDGKHIGRHSAGDDLSEMMINAPHNEEAFIKFRIVGELSEKEFSRKQLAQKIEQLHLHSMSVHFPIVFSIIVPIFLLLYLFTGKVHFEIASYYLLLSAFFSSPFAVVSGFLSWKITYEGRMTKTFARKIKLTVLLVVVVTTCSVWRILNPNVLTTMSILSYIYLVLGISLGPIIMILGHYGGKIVYS